ncbi:MAG: outer membrane protein assembly factor BamA [Gemmatimonadetes bacterium]|jgi:outer membrane protein insertion porin family|nr:outer membrane protein assembly factor BamA [Gemmatimonadota bacterium]
MRKLLLIALALCGARAPLRAQDDVGRCATPDSVVVAGNKRVPSATVLLDAGIATGTALNAPSIQRAMRNIFSGGQFDDVRIECKVLTTPQTAYLQITVVERPLLDFVDVSGIAAVPSKDVKDKVELLIGRPVDPALVARAIQRMDSVYQANGYYLARIKADTTVIADNHITIQFKIDEGRRLSISGVKVTGNKKVPAAEIVSSLKTKPEGFWWWRGGEFDADKYAQDLGDSLPNLFARKGFIDFQLLKDTLVVDRERGKAMVEITVDEGKQYKVGTFEVTGNKRFNSEDINRFYPFTNAAPSLQQRLNNLVRRKPMNTGMFDKSVWDEATQKVRTAYYNEGYLYAQVRPIMDRASGDSGRVTLRWDIVEGSPAIINRIDIVGNDYTHENCIRDQLVLIPGDVFSQDRLLRSYQSIGNLGFFDTPLAFPETRPANDQGDVDIIFHVKEKRTGNVSFGASMGQGTGLGGFIGLDQPNLFGKCKKGSLNWQYGRYINDFQLSYTDPAIQQSRLAGTITAYHSQSRYTIADLGQTTRTGGSVRMALPFFNSRFTRIGVSYGLEAVRFSSDGFVGTITTNNCSGCLRSTLSLDMTRDTRSEVPFPSEGTLSSVTTAFNGGILGGTASFQRITTEFRSFTTLMRIGGDKPGSQPLKIVAGLSQRNGFVFGNAGPFFSNQEFALGGVQYGEPLRGYPEFSVTPLGYNPSTGTNNAVRQSFGNAFFTATAEVGLRVSSQFYADIFYEAGNVWQNPRDYNPSRLFRSFGIGASVISPLGPLGLDWAYGFDRVDANGLPDPKWQIHFKLGQFFN